MQLAEKGKLSLDDPVRKYIPLKLEPKGGKPIRIWHLLCHTSGIPALAYAEGLIRCVTGAGGKWVPIASAEDLFTFMKDASQWVLAKPGERWFYLNEGYVILGYIIERVSGLGYDMYVKENILKPLKMDRSFFRKEDVEADTNVATPYIITRNGEPKKSVFPYGIYADGGLISNVVDLAHYIIMYLNRGKYDGNTLASSKSIKERWRNHGLGYLFKFLAENPTAMD